MQRTWIAATLALLLGGCAPYAWVKPDVTAEVEEVRREMNEESRRATKSRR